MLRPILVFWPPGLRTLVCVVSQFVTVVIHDLTCILFLLFPLFLISDLGCVDFGSRGGRIPKFSGVPFILMLLLLLVFPSLIRRLGLWGGSGGLKSLRVFSTIHHSLGPNFVHGCVSRSTLSENLYVSFSHVRTRSYARFGLGSHHFRY